MYAGYAVAEQVGALLGGELYAEFGDGIVVVAQLMKFVDECLWY